MQEIMLVNPNKRRAKKKRATKRSSPARRKTASRRKSPAKRRTSSARRSGSRRTYRKNPAPRTMMRRVIDRQVVPAAIQAGGALGVDWLYGQGAQYLPSTLTGGMMKHVTKGGAAVLLATLASNFMRNDTANQIAKGSLTVTMYEAGKDALEGAGITMGYYSASPVIRRRRNLSAYQRMPSRRLTATGGGGIHRGGHGNNVGLYQRAPAARRPSPMDALTAPEAEFNSADI